MAISKRNFKKITTELDSYIIFVTATEPLIFERDEVVPLADRDYYFNALDRVVIKPKIERDMTIEEFSDYIEIQEGKSYLFVFNTIKSAEMFYDILQEK